MAFKCIKHLGMNEYKHWHIHICATFWQSGCLNEAQTWKSMTTLNNHLPLEEAWGPEVRKLVSQIMNLAFQY